MAISQSKYIRIISSIGGGSTISQRELIGRVFTSNYLVPNNRVIEFGGGSSVALASIGEYFGLTSDEYKFAQKYFDFTTSANTQPKKLSFARYNDESLDSMLISGKGLSLSAIQGITSGTLNISVGSDLIEKTAINLSSATSFSDVADALSTLFSDDGISAEYDSANGRIVLVCNVEGSSLSYATGTVAETLKLVESEAILQEAQTELLSPLETVSASASLSNNFFSFCFLDTLTVADITAVAEWTDAQNVKYMYSVPVNATNYSTIQTAVKDYDGVALTLDLHNEHAEFVPMCAFASVDYSKPNSILDVFYKQFDLTPSVDKDSAVAIYDPLRINYYGTTQQAGQLVSFYQNGYLQGSIPSMTVFSNEAWLKDSFIADVLNMRMALDSLPANSTGKSLVLSALMKTVNQALTNGVVLAGKELDATQKAYITTLTGDSDAWMSVQNAGYRLSAEIEKYTEDGIEKYKISFLFVYSKGDTINYVDGSDILI